MQRMVSESTADDVFEDGDFHGRREAIPPAGFEPATSALGKPRSIQLSYEGSFLVTLFFRRSSTLSRTWLLGGSKIESHRSVSYNLWVRVLGSTDMIHDQRLVSCLCWSIQRNSNVNLFAAAEEANRARSQPLAARMRPRNLSEFVGQQHLLGPGKLLRRLIDARALGSLIFYGPPGCGKTTLAKVLAHETQGEFRQLSAVTSGVKELRETLQWARDEIAAGGRRPILFIDEIHRFNRAQQDALLPDVEDGVITLIGATTSNPFFAVNGALLSRSQVMAFEPLTSLDLEILLRRAIADERRGLGTHAIDLAPGAIEYLASVVDGDARQAFQVLEIAVLSSSTQPVRLTRELLQESMQRKVLQFDPTGDEHYDLASALIKSIRGSDVDASIYWLARALESGEDIRFLSRRLIILASEDIGNADPQALPLAVASMQACEFIGLPECQLTLTQTVIYLALAPKSNTVVKAIDLARQDVREHRTIPVPKHLRDGHYAGAKQIGNGIGYQYSHDSPDGVAAQDYLSVDRQYFESSDRGFEAVLSQRYRDLRKLLKPDPSAE